MISMAPERRMNIGEAFSALPQTRIQIGRSGLLCSERSAMEKLKAQDCVSNPACEEDGAGLPVVRPGAAAIDLGSEVPWVCAPKVGGGGRDVGTFGATTPELEKMAAWLKERKVETIALESTGVY